MVEEISWGQASEGLVANQVRYAGQQRTLAGRVLGNNGLLEA